MKPVDEIFPEAKKLKDSGKCPTCKEDVGTFRNKASEREFDISGMCQKCQDSVFGMD
jgi:formylmethanofuran dehydrogenase subunit E